MLDRYPVGTTLALAHTHLGRAIYSSNPPPHFTTHFERSRRKPTTERNMSQPSQSGGPQLGPPIQLEPSTMSDNETSPTKTRRSEDASPEPVRKKLKVSHYPAMVDVVDEPKGDLVIKVGLQAEDMGLVRVHKAILMMASPIFRKMLSDLDIDRKYDESDPLVLDDDRTPFIDFCMIIHHQNKDEHAVPLSRSAALAVIFDKYSCTPLLQIIAWQLREFFGANLGEVYLPELKAIGLRLEDVMCIAYVADDAKLFYRCTRFMIARLAADKSIKNLKTNRSLLSLMPQKLVGKQKICPTLLTRILRDCRSYAAG